MPERPWSQKVKCFEKEFDMDKNEIDDLLRVVSPELIKGYEAKNLDGKSLSDVNEEYNAVTQLTGMDFIDWIKLIGFSMLIATVLAFYLLYKGVPVYIGVIAIVALVLPIELYLLFPVRWKFEKDRATRYRCEPILRDFKQAVEASNPFRTTKQTFPYTADSVWGILVLLAIHVLEAKEKFLAECKAENPTIKRVQNCIVVEQGSRCMFNSAFEASSKFGLDFSKERVYQAAQDELANQWIRV